MKKKVIMALVAFTLVPAIFAAPPSFIFGDDWWFESPSLINTRSGWKFVLTYKGDFDISGKILAITYFSQEQFMPSPVDILIGWGEVVTPENLENIEILPDTRTFFWRNKSKLKDDYVASHLINIHVIPNNEVVAGALLNMQIYDAITLRGKIVDVAPQSEKKSATWQTTYLRTDAARGESQIALVSMITINDVIYSERGETISGRDIVADQVTSVSNVIMTSLAKYGIYFVILLGGLIALYLFNTIALRGYSAKKSDICVLTTEGRERSFEYLRAFENFGDDILIVLSHVRSKGPTERSYLEKKYGRKPVQYLVDRRYFEIKKS